MINARVKRTYAVAGNRIIPIPERPKKNVEFKIISAEEFTVDGHVVYLESGNTWLSNPPINDVFLKERVNRFINKKSKCNSLKLCKPVYLFDTIEECSDCKKVL